MTFLRSLSVFTYRNTYLLPELQQSGTISSKILRVREDLKVEVSKTGTKDASDDKEYGKTVDIMIIYCLVPPK